ncbi:MAG: DUF6054 family protein [Oscillospiraceae bacterium]|nr:DUF6054 family protein [Oscillospiraceae bacterium]
MAKHERNLTGNFDELLRTLHDEIMGRSLSASFQDGSDYRADDVRCAVRVYERYSVIGSNRLSANITLVGRGDRLFLTVIASGGSQAMFFKINTFGEESFLEKIIKIVNEFEAQTQRR